MSTTKPSLKIKHKTKESEGMSDHPEKEREIGGFENRLEPTRYGDWESNGRCSDF